MDLVARQFRCKSGLHDLLCNFSKSLPRLSFSICVLEVNDSTSITGLLWVLQEVP